VRLLNEALATEIVCVLRYRRHHYMAKGIHATAVAEEFLRHSQEEQGHADQIAERIVQLGARRTSTRPVSAQSFGVRRGGRARGDDPRESRRGARRHRVLQ
jgi:DNA-binding ferritin-like protein